MVGFGYPSYSDYIDMGSTFQSTFRDSFTLSAWIKPDDGDPSYTPVIFGQQDSAGDNSLIYLQINTDAKLEMRYMSEADGIYATAASATYSNGQETWHHVVAVVNNTTNQIYLYNDGSLVTLDGTNDGDISSATMSDYASVHNPYIGTINATGSPASANYYAGGISNFQIWDKAWTQSDVTYAYLNPEKLALDNPGTSLTYSDLKLWYPMQDGDRGNQSFLLDGANTGLSDELITNGDFSDGTTGWSNTGLSEFSVSNGQATITGVDTGDHIYLNDVTGNADGKRYRMTLDIASFTGTSFGMNHNGANANFDGSGVNGSNARGLTTTGIHTFDFTWTTGYAADPRIFVVNGTLVINSFSLKTINDKNHGTSVFYGDEQISATNDRTFAGASNWANAAGANAFASYDETTSGQLTVTPDDVSDVQYAFLDGANFDDSPTMVAGRTYRLSYDIHVSAFTKGTLSVGMSTDAVPAIMKVKNDYTATNGSGATATLDFVYVAADHEMITVYAAANTVLTVDFDNISLKEVGFATGWTDTDAQPTIPQLGFQSYNQLGWFDGTADTVDFGSPTVLDNLWDGGGSISFWMFQSTDDSGQILNKQWYISRQGSKLRFYLHYDGGSDVDLYMDSSADLPYGDWVHVVITMDSDAGTNDAAMYLNGVLDKNVNDRDGEDTRTSDASNDFDLQSIEGSLTELSAWDKELSISEVQELYNDGEALDALTHSSATNLAGYWRNEGSVTWTDLSTNSNNGTPASVTEYLLLPKGQNGRDTQGFLMNRFRSSGLNTPISGDVLKHSWILLGSTTTVAAGTAYSVTAWVRPYDYTGSRLGWIGRDAGDYIQIVNATTIRVRQNSGNQDFTVSSMTVGEWVNISVTRTTGNVITVYVDGVINGGASTDTITDADSFQYSYIGSKLQGYPFEGNVDDIAVYTTALSQAQVTRNYKAGKGRHRN